MPVVKTNIDGLTFAEWQQQVDHLLLAKCGLSSLDLADGPAWDSWNDGVPPEDYASDLLYDNGFPSELD